MLDFICAFEKLLAKWPENAHWTLAQIADQTNTGLPLVVDFISDALNKELEVHEAISFNEGKNAFNTLRERVRPQLAARQKKFEAKRQKAIQAYDLAMEKVRVLLAAGNWRSAYKTLSYCVGYYEKDLPEELIISVAGECLRLGFKAKTNLQELSQWMRKGLNACLKSSSPDAIEDALDFLDAYFEMFLQEDEFRSRRLINNMVGTVKDHAAQNNLQFQFEMVAREYQHMMKGA